MDKTMRESLMLGTMKIASEMGLENVTTKKIAAAAKASEATLFRLFESKEALLLQTFAYAENELFQAFLSALPVFREDSLDYESCCRVFFARCWRYLLANPDQNQFYLRFYYSLYYEMYARQQLEAGLPSLIDRMQKKLRNVPDNGNTKILLMRMLDTMLNFAARVASGELSNTDETAESVFRLLFNLLETYQKTAEQNSPAGQRTTAE